MAKKKITRWYLEYPKGQPFGRYLNELPEEEDRNPYHIYLEVTATDITFHANYSAWEDEDSFYGKDRKTLKAAIKDAMKFADESGDNVEIWAEWKEHYHGVGKDWMYFRDHSYECEQIGTCGGNFHLLWLDDDYEWLTKHYRKK